MSPPGLVLLISGRGSNALAIIDAATTGRIDAPVHAVIADRSAAGLDAAAERGIDTATVPRRAFGDRAAFERALAETVDGFEPGLIALAGFMRVLSAGFVQRYAGRMVNIHPSLLPRYRGLDTHARALAAGDREHGASVHWVTPELDAGPVIAQARVAVEPGDTAERLAARVLAQEHRLYPATLALLLADPVSSSHDTLQTNPPPPLVLDRDLDAAGRRIDRG
jgi:phosphoribosylglycinamide formyltransferase-1